MIQPQIDTDTSNLVLSSIDFSLKTQPNKLRNMIFHQTIYLQSNVEKIKCTIDLLDHMKINITFYFSQIVGYQPIRELGIIKSYTGNKYGYFDLNLINALSNKNML